MHHPWPPIPNLSFLLLLFLLSLFLSLLSPIFSDDDYYIQRFRNCSSTRGPFSCAGGSYSINVSYPFYTDSSPDYCGYRGFNLSCQGDDITITIGNKGHEVKGIDYQNYRLTVVDQDFVGKTCTRPSVTTTLDAALFDYTDDDVNVTLFTDCSSPVPTLYGIDCLAADGLQSYLWPEGIPLPTEANTYCTRSVQLWLNRTVVDWMMQNIVSAVEALQAGFTVEWTAEVWENCGDCMQYSNGVCGWDDSKQICMCSNGLCPPHSGSSGNKRPIIIGVCVGVAALAIATFFGLFFYRRRKRRQLSSSTLLPQTISSEPSSKKDAEFGSEHQPTQIFDYEELQAATDGFSASNELGDGGFGTVYKGNLQDGRTVAIKRLYENNYRRVEQFMTEVTILSSLRHPNLVSLYGCTSRHSRELLLVFEYIANGTVADHLHGPRAGVEGLAWPVRMSIAIETADALSYLHAVTPQIIHRDVKTNNILLDNSFRVKVADFGLSRLFPVNATHVSTAPQGTPGYVDPEYYQCYQLTDKSDVYSFGVVLVELISSKPAVDISRPRHEVNLASMAITKIQNEELDQFVDQELWCQPNREIIWMIRQVAEVAFRCLQANRDMRPTMKEVLEALKGIKDEGCNRAKGVEADVMAKDDDCLLKGKPPHSPDTVTAKWESRLTTPNSSV